MIWADLEPPLILESSGYQLLWDLAHTERQDSGGHYLSGYWYQIISKPQDMASRSVGGCLIWFKEITLTSGSKTKILSHDKKATLELYKMK